MVLLLFAFFLFSLATPAEAAPTPLQLFFSGNVQGETESCG